MVFQSSLYHSEEKLSKTQHTKEGSRESFNKIRRCLSQLVESTLGCGPLARQFWGVSASLRRDTWPSGVSADHKAAGKTEEKHSFV